MQQEDADAIERIRSGDLEAYAVLASALPAAVRRAGAPAAAVLTSVVLVGGFEIASPLGVLDLLTGGARGSTDDAEV